MVDDLTLLQISNILTPGHFHHSKLDSNLKKAFSDPFKLVQGGINEALRTILNSCSFMFGFETKVLYTKVVGLLSVDS